MMVPATTTEVKYQLELLFSTEVSGQDVRIDGLPFKYLLDNKKLYFTEAIFFFL